MWNDRQKNSELASSSSFRVICSFRSKSHHSSFIIITIIIIFALGKYNPHMDFKDSNEKKSRYDLQTMLSTVRKAVM